MTVIALAGSVVAAGCATTARAPAGASVAPAGVAAPGRWVSGEYANAAGSRRYQLYLPAGYDATQKRMLVVLLHGCTQDAADFARGTRIAEHADRDGFIALLPEQPASANAKKCWNWYDPAHQARDGGEPSLIAGMTAKIAGDYAVDPGRVHLAGVSAGAAMAALVAVAYPETYASVAFHSGIAWKAATNVVSALGVMANGVPIERADTLGVQAAAAMGTRARWIPALIIQGGSDKVVNPANADALAQQWVRMNEAAMPNRGPYFGIVDEADPGESSGEANGYHVQSSVLGAGPDASVKLIVAELGHAWSGGSSTGTFTDVHGPDATAEILKFFRATPRSGTR